MNIQDLKQLLNGKQIIDLQTEDQDFEHGLRLMLRDTKTGDLGLLAIEPMQLVLPDEIVLDYSYQDLSLELGPPPPECVIVDLKTNVAPAYEKGEVPFLF